MEAQVQKLRDEVIQVKQQRKRELIQLRHVRDQETLIMQSNFDSQVSPVRFSSTYLCLMNRAGFKCVDALGRIIIRGPSKKLSGGVLVSLSVWSKVQTTL